MQIILNLENLYKFIGKNIMCILYKVQSENLYY